MKIFRILFIVAVILFIVPRIVHAQDLGSVYFYDVDEEGEYTDNILNVEFVGDFTIEEKAHTLIQLLFEYPIDVQSCVPKGTKLLSVKVENNGKLKLNMSKEGLNCAGNSRQELFVNQIVKTAYSLKEIRGIILFVEGKETNLPEGVDFSYFNR